MDRFYFHIKEGGRLVAVDAGLDLPGPKAAQEEAIQTAREILAEHVRTGADLHVEAVLSRTRPAIW